MTKTGLTVRRWTFSQSQAAVWTWDGRDSSARYVPDASYVFRVAGTDPAGNQTITNMWNALPAQTGPNVLARNDG